MLLRLLQLLPQTECSCNHFCPASQQSPAALLSLPCVCVLPQLQGGAPQPAVSVSCHVSSVARKSKVQFGSKFPQCAFKVSRGTKCTACIGTKGTASGTSAFVRNAVVDMQLLHQLNGSLRRSWEEGHQRRQMKKKGHQRHQIA